MKQVVRTIEISTTPFNWMPWEDNRTLPFSMKGATGSAWVKRLGFDPDTGAESLLYKLSPGWSIDRMETTAPEDLLVWQGELEVGGQTLRKHSYSYRPPGYSVGPCSSPLGATIVAFCGAPDEPLCSKVAVPALDTAGMPWIPSTVAATSRYYWKALRGDEENLSLFRLLRGVAGSRSDKPPGHGHEGIGGIEEGFCLEGRGSSWDESWNGALVWTTTTPGAYGYHGLDAHPGHSAVEEDTLWFKHDGYIHGPDVEQHHAESNLEAILPMFPKVTPAVKALMEGRDPGLPARG